MKVIWNKKITDPEWEKWMTCIKEEEKLVLDFEEKKKMYDRRIEAALKLGIKKYRAEELHKQMFGWSIPWQSLYYVPELTPPTSDGNTI